MTNICLINDSFPPMIDGVANAVKNYADIIETGLGKATVATPFYPGADDSSYPYPVVRYASLDTTKQVGYRTGLPLDTAALQRLQGQNIDLIHAHCPITSTFLARALRETIHKPIVLTYHTKFDIDIENSIRSRLLQEEALEALIHNIDACDEVWTVSRGAGENLRKNGFQGDYIVMPNGVDVPKGKVSLEAQDEIIKGLDVKENIPLFLFVGRMMWYKGIRISLDALAALNAKGKDFRMVFVGGGGDIEDIKNYTTELGLASKVFFTGPIYDREKIRAWYSRADLFLFPSTFDTNGLVVREAAACGLASILVKGSCAAEDSTDGVDGLLIEENAASMAAALEKVIEHPEICDRLGKMAQTNLYLSWEDAVKNAWNRYQIVMDRYARGITGRKEAPGDHFFVGFSDVIELDLKRRAREEKLHREVQKLLEDNSLLQPTRALRQAEKEIGSAVDEYWQDAREFAADFPEI